MINTIPRRLIIAQCDEKCMITMVNFFKTTWINRYLQPMEIMYGQGHEFIGRDILKCFIEKQYGNIVKQISLGNKVFNKIS